MVADPPTKDQRRGRSGSCRQLPPDIARGVDLGTEAAAPVRAARYAELVLAVDGRARRSDHGKAAANARRPEPQRPPYDDDPYEPDKQSNHAAIPAAFNESRQMCVTTASIFSPRPSLSITAIGVCPRARARALTSKPQR